MLLKAVPILRLYCLLRLTGAGGERGRRRGGKERGEGEGGRRGGEGEREGRRRGGKERVRGREKRDVEKGRVCLDEERSGGGKFQEVYT